MSWSVWGAGPVDERFRPPRWDRIAYDLPSKAAAERWVQFNVDRYVSYAIAAVPQPLGKPIDNREWWEIFQIDKRGYVVSSRDGRRLGAE